MIVVGEQDKKYDAMIYEHDGRRGLMYRHCALGRPLPTEITENASPDTCMQ